MTDKHISQDYLDGYKKIDEKLNNNLLKYLKVGDFPETNMNFHMDVYNFVAQWGNVDTEAEDLYNNFNRIVKELAIHFKNQVSQMNTSELLEGMIERAKRMDIVINFLTKTFSFLDFYFCKFRKCPNLCTSSLSIYREFLFMPFQKEVTAEVNKLLKEDREGKLEHRNVIKKILLIMKTMDFAYPKIVKEKDAVVWFNGQPQEANTENAEPEKTPIQDFWYKYFKEDTEQFVVNKAKKDIQNRSTPEYVSIQLKFIDEETERQTELINKIFYDGLNAIIFKEIIGKYMIELVDMDTGVKNMLENNKYQELTDLYNLFKYYEPSLHEISRIFKQYIEARGNALRQNQELYRDPKKIVPKLVDLLKEINVLVLQCFKNNSILQKAKNKAFGNFMNSDYYSKQLANYLDYCMRAGFKGKSPEYVDNTLNDIIALFKNLNTKYIFQQITEKRMSERLIKDSTLSINYEKNFISKLKQESDISLVSKMSGMMSDLDTNKNETVAYRNSPSKGEPNGIKFSVQVISNNAWEVGNKNILEIKLPPLFSSCIEDFEKYYLKKYPEQKLIWHLGFSKVEIQYLYLKNKNISISTLPQILILLELEKSEPLSIKQLSEKFGCPTELIENSIEGLIFNPSFNQKCEKNKGVIISTTTQKSEFNDTDEFKINPDFKSIKQKFNTIPMPKKKSEQQLNDEEKASKREYERYEGYLIQSNLIRIMKSRIGQVTTHNWLVSEAIKQIDRLKAQPQQIKENIEKLIEKNCIKRDEKNKGCYEYVA